MLSDDCNNKLKLLFNYFLKNKTNFTEVILNLLLVCHGVRPAFLYEESNYIKKIICTQLFHEIIDKINDLGCLKLKTTKDSNKFTRIFVYLDDESHTKIYPGIYPVDNIIKTNPDSVNNDREIAKMLDFNCIEHNYSSSEINRISIHVNINNISDKNNTYNIKTEVCEASKFNQKEADDKYLEFKKKINNVINEYNFECFYTITYLFNYQTKLHMLRTKNIKFILKYLNEYLNDLINDYISDEVELERSTTYKKFVDITNTIKNDKEYGLLVNTYIMMVNNEFNSCYKNAHTYDEIKKVSKELTEEDIKLWEAIKKTDGKRKSKRKSKRRSKRKSKRRSKRKSKSI